MLPYKNHSEKLQQIINGELSLKENVAYFLQRIADNSHLTAFNQVFAEEAIYQAKIIQQKIKDRKHGKLAGLVVAIKDVLSIKDKLTICSSNILKNFTSIYTATAVQKLIDEDAIIIVKLIAMNLQWDHQMKIQSLVRFEILQIMKEKSH